MFKTTAGALITSDTVTMTLDGNITEQSTDGYDPNPSGANFAYDAGGRLTDAYTTSINASGVASGRHYTYGFGTEDASCASGTQTNTGLNTNRTSASIYDGTATNIIYCYDAADRLISSTNTGIGTPAYDSHGNTTSLWGETRGYDSSDRHLTTTKGSTAVTYTRDGTDRIIQRSSVVSGATVVERYGSSGDDAAADFVMDATNTLIQRSTDLPGDVTVTLPAVGGQQWAYTNLHGDITATANASGVKQGKTITYDPYGTPTGATVADTAPGNLDYGWLGDHRIADEHETALHDTNEMGARQYDPTLGRFLEVDPIEGGSANDYDYVNADPINAFDYDGTCRTKHRGLWGAFRSVRCRASHGIGRAGRKIRRVKNRIINWRVVRYGIRYATVGWGMIRGVSKGLLDRVPVFVPCSVLGRYCTNGGRRHRGYAGWGIRRRHGRRRWH